MKALRLYGPHDLRLHDEPRPETIPDQALLRVTAVGICGSDLHWFSEGSIGDATLGHPLIIGHEFAGIVEDGRLRGRRVAVDPQVPCEKCEFCREGNPNLCPTHIFAGLDPDDGALRQFMPWPESAFHHLPDSLTDEDGAMLEPLGVAIHAVDLAHLRPGMAVGVIGCGPIGAAAVFQAGDDREEARAILADTNQRGLDVLFEAAGENPAVDTAIDTVKPGGRVILAGIPSDNRTSFNASTARRKGVTIMLVRRMKNTYPRATQLVVDGLVDVRSLVTHRFSMENFEEAFAVALRREGLKVMITP